MKNILIKIMRFPEIISNDKRIHIICGSVLTSIILLLGINYIFTFMFIVIIAWSVEVFQYITKSGTYDNLDAVAVVSGGIIVLLPFIFK